MNTNESIITAQKSKKAAKLFSYGNILSVLIPFPLFIFWFGASMLIYAFHRHHPNPRVGFYTQKAAYNYYALAGILSVVMLFASGDFFYKFGWYLWIACILILIPLSIKDILSVNKEDWKDVTISRET
ncbi:MAG: hypothetical protein V3U71_06425 [Cocleimonas sp.]